MVFLASCAPYCEVPVETSFTATITQLNLQNREVVVRQNQTSVIIQLVEQSSILNQEGSSILINDLLVGQQLSVQGILLQNSRVEADKLRLLQ